MLPEPFLNSWVNETHRVLGRRLQPYSLWHRFALEVVESPFIAPDGRPSISDLDIAARICSSRYPTTDAASFFRLIKSKQPGERLSWRRKLQFSYLARRYDPAREGALFVAYVRDYYAPPKFWEQAGEGAHETSGAPPEMLGVATRLIRGGFSEERAWNMAIGKAYWHAATLARIDGAKLDFVSESQDLFAWLTKLKTMHKAGKLKFTPKGFYWQE